MYKNRIGETTATGFEPVQVKPNCLAGNRLNHSAKLSRDEFFIKIYFLNTMYDSATGNRTRGNCVTGSDVTNYTIAEYIYTISQRIKIYIQCLKWDSNPRLRIESNLSRPP